MNGSAPAASGTRPGWFSTAVPRARSRLRANFGWTLAGNVVYAGCQWGILVAVARLASAEAVGKLALGLAVTAPVFLLAGLHLRASLATDAARAFRFADYFGVRLAGMIAALIATAAIVSLSGYDRATGLVVLAIGGSKAVEGMSDVYYGLLQQNERMRHIAVSLIWRGVLSLLAVGAVLWAGGGLLLSVAAIGLSWTVVLIAYDRRAAARFPSASVPPRLHGMDWRPAGRIVAISLPLGLVMMLLSLRFNIPRYFVQNAMGASELGVFAAVASLLTAGTMVVSALGQSATPALARQFHEGDVRGFRRLVARLLAIAGIVGCAGVGVAVVAGDPLLRLIFGSAYATRSELLVLLMAVGLVAYAVSMLGYALTAARRFMVQLPLFAATTLVCAGASLWLVPAYGLAGAASAMGAAALLELVAIWVVLEIAIRTRKAGGSP
jgi:O-antigen/teichoic acid export membrane protein